MCGSLKDIVFPTLESFQRWNLNRMNLNFCVEMTEFMNFELSEIIQGDFRAPLFLFQIR